MNNIFLILGYGVPKNILKDENYNFYLKTAFNKIYDIVAKNKIDKPIIIACGGPTDILKPYKRTEAEKMIKLFDAIIKKRPSLKPITKNWLFIPEKKSLSTLENLLNSKKIIQKRKIKKAGLFVFCEQTREKRIKILVKKIFDKNYISLVMPIDFDMSVNRYLPAEYLNKKEKAELKHSLWVLGNPKNLKKHHKIFGEKMEYFRKAGHKTHVNAVKEWWDENLGN